MKIRLSFQKFVFICLTIALAGILFLSKTTIATGTEDYPAFPEKDTKQLLSTLIKIMTEEWISLAASGRATEQEMVVPLILREAVRIDALRYLLVDAPVDIAFKVTTKTIKIASQGFSIPLLLGEFEKLTVKMAVKKGMEFLQQNEIRMTPGALEIRYVSKKGKPEQAIFQYILVFKPLSQKQGEVVIEIYSPQFLEPPESRGFITVQIGTPNALEANLPPFIVKVQGKAEKDNLGAYHWVGMPKVEIYFPAEVPDLGFRPLGFWQRHLWKPLEDTVKEAKEVLKKIIAKPVQAAEAAAGAVKNISSDVINKVKSFFTEQKPKTEAQIATPKPKEAEPSPPPAGGGLGSAGIKPETGPAPLEARPLTGRVGNLDNLVEQLDEISEQIEVLAVQTQALILAQADQNIVGTGSDPVPVGTGSDPVPTIPTTKQIETTETPKAAEKPATVTQNITQTPTYHSTVSLPTTPPAKLLISEIQKESENGASDEFVELYNPNPNNVSLAGWSLQKMTKTGTVSKKNFTASDSIAPQGYFLVVNSYASQELLVAASLKHHSFDITSDSTILLVASTEPVKTGGDDAIADKVGFGQARSPETNPAPEPEKGQSIGRKWLTASQTEQDTNNNQQDFELQTPTPKTQNQTLPAPPPPAGGGGAGGGAEEPEPTPTSTPKILISEVQTESSSSTKDEFVELYNPNDFTVPLAGFALKKKTASGAESNLVSSTNFSGSISALNYFLITPQDKASGDLHYSGQTYSIADNNVVLLYDQYKGLVDETPSLSHPKGYSAGRKWATTSEAYQDTDNFENDFEPQTPTPGAQNQRDLTPPEVLITSKPPALTNQTQASFTFFANEESSTFQCKIDEQDWQNCVSPTNYNGLADGSCLFQVKATDLVGNTSETAGYSWTIDATIESPSLALSASTSTGLLFTNSQIVFVQVTQDTEAVAWFLSENSNKPAAEDPDWSAERPSQFTLSPTDGVKTAYVWTKDQANNVSALGNSAFITLDTTAPAASIAETPDNPTNQTTSTFVFSCNEENCAFQYKLDDNDWQEAGQPSSPSPLSLSESGEGEHILQLKAFDQAENQSATTSHRWLVDLTAPSSQFQEFATTSASAEFTLNWTGSDSPTEAPPGAPAGEGSGIAHFTVQYKDGSTGEWQDLAVATTTLETDFTGQDGHTYYFRIKAADKAGNEEPWQEDPEASCKIATPKDETPPDPVTDLSAQTGENFGEIVLFWTSPADNWTSGKPAQYIIKYYFEEITEQNWASSTLIANPPLPQEASTTQSFTVSGLADSAVYYFALKSQDEAGNISLISNSPYVETKNHLPEAGFSFSPQNPIIAEQEVMFDASQSSDQDGDITYFVWDFGDNIVTTTPSSTISHSFSSPGQYLVVLVVADEEGATSSPVSAIVEVAEKPWSKIVISEVQIKDRFSTDHDFIELFNPTEQDIEITNFQLKKRALSDTTYSVVKFTASSSTIPALGYFLWANSSYTNIGGISPDITRSQTLAANNSIALFDDEGEVIDQVAWGEATTTSFVETAAFPKNPTENQSLTRKKDENGNYTDTNNNSQDFSLANPTPTNSQGQTGNMLPPEAVANLQTYTGYTGGYTGLTCVTSWTSSTDMDTNQENISYTVYYWEEAELTEESAGTGTAGLSTTTTASTTLALTELAYNSAYYFGVRAFDGLYYSPVATTTLHTPPPAIDDLTAAPSANREAVDLLWTSKGGASYLIRYATDTVPGVAWETATAVENSLSPKVSGEIEFFTMENLPANQVVYFAIKTVSQNNVTSAVSNSASSTAIMSFQDNGDGTITDLYTGLMWVKDGNSAAANNGTATTQFGAAVFVNQLNAAGGFAGWTDWRVPNFRELASIINYNKTAPTADENFANLKQSDYWTSSKVCTRQPSASVGDPGRYYGYSVSFNDGSVNINYYDGDNSPSLYLLPVRGSENLQSGLAWTETLTGIGYTDVFGECGVGWKKAMQVAQDSEIDGHTDWRLPNVRELLSVAGVLTGEGKENHWTITPDFADTSKKWFVNLWSNMGQSDTAAESQSYFIKLVRDKE